MLFLTSYLIYHYHHLTTRFQGTGIIRTVYFTILVSHTILAAFVPFLAIITLGLAWKSKFQKHRKIARWTLPIWLYVSVTGVVVYWMLYRM
jgi:putative membrane protein